MEVHIDRSNLIVRSKLSLYRNLSNFPFPHQATNDQLKDISQKIITAIYRRHGIPQVCIINITNLTLAEVELLKERRLIEGDEDELFEEPRWGENLIKIAPYNLNLIINGEDHIKFQMMGHLCNLDSNWLVMQKVANSLSDELGYAFFDEWGYLGPSIKRIGTGLRIAIDLHLPALSISKSINKLITDINYLGWTMNPMFKYKNKHYGYFYTLFNKITLGKSEEELLKDFHEVVECILQREEKLFQEKVKTKVLDLEKIFIKTYYTLTKSEKISMITAVEHLSRLRVARMVGFVSSKISLSAIDDLIINIQNAHLIKVMQQQLLTLDLDTYRAQVIKEQLLNDEVR
ncbi:MAG: hypothetical protein V1872_03540 [bacterium]